MAETPNMEDIRNGWPPKYRKYDFEVGDGTAIISKSGFTPLQDTFPTIPRDQEQDHAQAQLRVDIEKFQRDSLYGFTSRELADLDVITNRRLKPSTLPTILHPLFRRERWETKPPDPSVRSLYHLPKGLPGYWTAQNDLVWNAIFPALQIATSVLENIHMLPWLTSLINNPKRKVLKSRLAANDRQIPTIGELKIFHDVGALTDDRKQKTISKLQTEIYALLLNDWNFTIGFKDTSQDPWDGSFLENAMGVTNLHNETLSVYLSYSIVMPLLRDDLSDAERMGCEWHTANTIIHEISHAIWLAEQELSHPEDYGWHEIYFEGDPISELGFSMEHHVFGGIAGPMRDNNMEAHLGYWLETEFPSINFAFRTKDPILTRPRLSNTQTFFPIKASFFEAIQQEDFWNAGLRVFGTRLLQASSLQQGAKVTYPGLGRYNRLTLPAIKIPTSGSAPQRITLPDSVLDFRAKLRDYVLKSGVNLSPQERANCDFGRQVINNSIWQQTFWEKSREMRKYLQDMMNTLTYTIRGKTALQRRTNLDNILTFLGNARRIHLDSIRALLALQVFSGIQKDKLEDLLEWNRGTRIYAKAVHKLALRDPDYLRSNLFSDETIELECCLMLLWSPDEDSNIEGLVSEIDQIDRTIKEMVGRNYLFARNALHALMASPDCSIFGEACARVLFSCLPIRMEGLSDSYNQAARGIDLLTRLRDGLRRIGGEEAPAALEKWEPHFERWVKNANQSINYLRAQALAGGNV